MLRRSIRRPQVHHDDRLLLLIVARLCRRWWDALHVVNPETLLHRHRDLFKFLWRRRSRPRGQPKRLAPEIVTLIQAMARDNVLWGAERIPGELLKLGFRVSKHTIQKYNRQVRLGRQKGPELEHLHRKPQPRHLGVRLPAALRYVLSPPFRVFLVVHGTREVVHLNVTHCPTDAWASQQLREATPYGDGPKYLIRDNDDKFGKRFAAVAEGTGIEVVKIPPRSPNLNPICERFLGSVRRECLDYVVILSERQLRRILKEYIEIYFNRARPHQGLRQGIPVAASRSVPKVGEKVVPIPILGELHHDYQWAA